VQRAWYNKLQGWFVGAIFMDLDEDAIRAHLAIITQEHRDMDGAIDAVQQAGTFDLLQVQRLKKRKLALKDEIEKFHTMLVPDIIA
jgi:hypothetical protein